MITTDDLNVVEGYVARDQDAGLFFYPHKPTRKARGIGYWANQSTDKDYLIPTEMFPNLKWEDEPIKVELSIKKI